MDFFLPKGWHSGKLYEVLNPIKASVRKYDGSKKYYSTGSISSEIVEEGIYDFEERPSRANREVLKDDILQARMRNTNKALLVSEELEKALFSTGFIQLRPYGNTILSKYVYYFLNSEIFLNQKDRLCTGATQQSINDQNAKLIDFLLPPLEEQKRIVTKLDKLFAQIEVIIKLLEGIPQLINNFRQQVLTQAVSGKLFKPKFIGRLEDYSIKIITGPFGSALHQKEYIQNGIPVINPSHIKNGQILNDLKVSITEEKFESLKAWHLLDGDVILGRRGEMGRAAFKVGNAKILCGTGSIILRGSAIDSRFLVYYLRSEFCINYLQQNSVGSTMVNLNQSILKSLPIPIYSLEEQQQMLLTIESSFLIANKIETQYKALKEEIDSLPQAILYKAFKGELVEHLPTDGDVKNLLAEIKKMKSTN